MLLYYLDSVIDLSVIEVFVSITIFSLFTVLCLFLNEAKEEIFIISLILFSYALCYFECFDVLQILASTYVKNETIISIIYKLIFVITFIYIVFKTGEKTYFSITNNIIEKDIFIYYGSLIMFYTCFMTCGKSFPPYRCLVFPLSILLASVYKKNKFEKNTTIVICALICLISFLIKGLYSYDWWGYDANNKYTERNNSIDIEKLYGFVLSEESKNELEIVTKAIKYNRKENDTLLGFPHIKLFNVLLDMYDFNDPTPLVFYDTCSDAAAEEELKYIINNNPNFIVYCYIPECLDVHENIFRNGKKLVQRDINNWILNNDDYIIIANVGNLYVYMKDDGRNINYTFFENKQ